MYRFGSGFTRAGLLALATAATLIPGACSHRLPVSAQDDAAVGVDGFVIPDISRDLPLDTLVIPPADLGPPQICQPLGQIPAATYHDPRGNFTLGFAAPAPQVTAITIYGGGAADSAVVFNGPGLAALALARQAQLKDPQAELAAIRQLLSDVLIKAKLVANVVVRASGASGTSHDGLPDVKEAIWDVELNKPLEPGLLRNLLLAAALNLPGTSALGGLPGAAVSGPSTKLMLRLTLVRRPTQIALVAAVANRADYDQPASELFRLVDDASNGTSLAAAGRVPTFLCDSGTVTGVPRADIIWIIDESGSTSDNRTDIVNNANLFFSKALAAGLDFRMGVAGMKKEAVGVELGKFCSVATADQNNDGGADRFLLPGEQAVFSACVKNPPYYEGGSEFGLTHGYWAVKRHLPRQASSPAKIRKDAKLTVIFVTDETAQGLKSGSHLLGTAGVLNGSDYSSSACTLEPTKAALVNAAIKPLMDLFSGLSDPEGKATVHLIGGTCKNGCNAEVTHGYNELAKGMGGQVGDICQPNLGATLQVIIDSIVAGASPQKLKQTPISATLAVAVDGVRIKRSRSAGFRYDVASNTLSFINVKVSKGQSLVASYHYFK